MTDAKPSAPERAFTVLRYPDFRWFWIAEVISVLGTRIQAVAIIWQVYRLTGDALQLGLLGLFRFLPLLLFGIMGGVIADGQDRRRTLLITQVILLLTSAALAILTMTGGISLVAIYAITFVSAAVGAVAQPTRQALIPSLVPRAALANAMTMNIFAFNVALVVGPAIGGLIIARVGVSAAYLVDVVSFFAVIAAVLALRPSVVQVPMRLSGLAAAVEGVRFLRRSPVLLGVMSVDFVATFFGASTVLMPIFADDVLGAGASATGYLLAAPAAGAVAGSVVMGSVRSPDRPGRGVLISVIAYGACITAFGFSTSLPMAMLFLAGSGAADAVSMALRHTVRNLMTPDALRGRIAAAHSTFAMGGPQLGEVEAGAVAALAGVRASIGAGGILTILATLFIARQFPAIARTRLGDAIPPDEPGEPVARAHPAADRLDPSPGD